VKPRNSILIKRATKTTEKLKIDNNIFVTSSCKTNSPRGSQWWEKFLEVSDHLELSFFRFLFSRPPIGRSWDGRCPLSIFLHRILLSCSPSLSSPCRPPLTYPETTYTPTLDPLLFAQQLQNIHALSATARLVEPQNNAAAARGGSTSRFTFSKFIGPEPEVHVLPGQREGLDLLILCSGR